MSCNRHVSACVFDDVHGFDTTVNAASDYDLYLRIARKFAISFHTDIVAEYREHGDSMSNNHQLMSNHIARVLQSQLKEVSGNRRHEEACRTGINFYQHSIGLRCSLTECEAVLAKRIGAEPCGICCYSYGLIRGHLEKP